MVPLVPSHLHIPPLGCFLSWTGQAGPFALGVLHFISSVLTLPLLLLSFFGFHYPLEQGLPLCIAPLLHSTLQLLPSTFCLYIFLKKLPACSQIPCVLSLCHCLSCEEGRCALFALEDLVISPSG